VQLLVGRAACPERELLHAVAAERRVRVAVDEPGDRTQAAAVDLLDIACGDRKLAHGADRLDRRPCAQHVGVLDHLDRVEIAATRRDRPRHGRRDLREIAHEEACRHAQS